MSARHNPGPWAVNPLFAQVDALPSCVAVCGLLWPTDERTEGETEANARLIALSPDLLAFAQGFIDNIDEWEGAPTPGQRWYAEYVQAKELVAEATGGAA